MKNLQYVLGYFVLSSVTMAYCKGCLELYIFKIIGSRTVIKVSRKAADT